ncbi:FoF1 ATP synthase subunit gamma [Allobaculum sp. Allo2]
MLAQLIPMIAKSVLYSKYMESKTSEQASRRMAMESATDNAEELEEKLNLEYNRVRQSAITQEITEIVGGANALK